MITNPEEIRTKNRRRNLEKIRVSKRWRQQTKHLTEGKTCEWCGTTEKLLVHHPEDTMYVNEETYLDFSSCQILCSRCHYHLHRGRVLCKTCKQHYHRTVYEQCYHCADPEARERAEAKKVQRLKKQREYRKKRVEEFKKKLKEEGRI